MGVWAGLRGRYEAAAWRRAGRSRGTIVNVFSVGLGHAKRAQR